MTTYLLRQGFELLFGIPTTIYLWLRLPGITLYLFDPSNTDSLQPSAPYFSVHLRMEDQTNMRNSTKNTDEKHSLENSVTPTWFTSAANATRKFSEKLLTWGVEERGAYPIVIFEHGQA